MLTLCLTLEPLWAALMPAALRLTRYGLEFRYPGDNATASHVKAALKDAIAVRREARLAFGLKS